MRHVGWLQEAWRRDFNEKSEFMTKTDPIVKEFYWESVGDESRKKNGSHEEGQKIIWLSLVIARSTFEEIVH